MSLHKYLYANSSPTVYCDPTGYESATLAEKMTVVEMVVALLPKINPGTIGFGATIARILTCVDLKDDYDIIEDIVYSNPYEASDEIEEEIEDNAIPDVLDGDEIEPPNYPGDDASKSPGADWEWRGKGEPSSGKGNWYKPKTGETLHPDLNHPEPINPHWDYKAPTGKWYRIYPGGRVIPK